MVRRPRRNATEPRPDGARFLDRYLRQRDVSVPAFCEEHDIDRMQVQRLLSGAAKRPDIGLLVRLDKATAGAVPVESWSPESTRLDYPGEVVPVSETAPAAPASSTTVDDCEDDVPTTGTG